ncbi:Aerobic C4-dicarboxylate transport protein [Kluyvera cryocrescens]|uniref:Aerobic C4-dicarboxylate transport protein n=1 Tax=Kluyvera cryocrescens TaxID=580 RepID=A0A485AM14_KLUCR|nr:Aerobic C4-dicarboxylate transport protein [Kluyvera cryocrescens]
MKAVGRTGAVALLYFEVVSTIALLIGLVIVNVVQPGAGYERRSGNSGCESGRYLCGTGKRSGDCRLPEWMSSRRA